MNRYARLWCFVLSAGSAVAQHPGSVATRCDQLYQLTDASQAVEPGVLIEASTSVPAHCRVRGVIDHTIRFEVTLPLEGWQGRLMFFPPGGLAGYLGDTTTLLDDGFAMATTDMGHEGQTPHFLENWHARIDYGFRSVHLATKLAKRIIDTFYGRPVEHSYLTSCSNGGRVAMIEAQRYPEDYDGILAGAPAMAWRESSPWGLAVVRAQSANPLTDESLVLLDANSRRRCDMLDGVPDGVIGDPRECTLERLDLDALRCEGDPSADCLTAGQLETATLIYRGVVDDGGQVLSPGVPPGAEAAGGWQYWVVGVPFMDPPSASEQMGGTVPHLFHGTPGFDVDQFDVVNDRQAISRETVSMDVPHGDFAGFRERGGKLIIYQGWNDFPIRPGVLHEYLQDAQERVGGPDAMASFSRLYMVPGMTHCMGGPGAWAADYLQALVDWVEEDQPPGRLTATHPGITQWFEAFAVPNSLSAGWARAFLEAGATKTGATRFTRPLCPYPQLAKYKGAGDHSDAANFECVEE